MTLNAQRPVGRNRESKRLVDKRDRLVQMANERDKAKGRMLNLLDRDVEANADLTPIKDVKTLSAQMDRRHVLDRKLFGYAPNRRYEIEQLLLELIREKLISISDHSKTFWLTRQLSAEAVGEATAVEVAEKGMSSAKARSIAYQAQEERRALANRSHPSSLVAFSPA